MNTLQEKQAARQHENDEKNRIENLFFGLCGQVGSVISPASKPFISFRPKDESEYKELISKLIPTDENFELTFAGSNPIQTKSPYSVHYGGQHDRPDYMDATVKFKHENCPVWIKMPKEKFTVTSEDGKHLGFGNYAKIYSLRANCEGVSVQNYYGDNKVLFAANETEADLLKAFVN